MFSKESFPGYNKDQGTLIIITATIVAVNSQKSPASAKPPLSPCHTLQEESLYSKDNTRNHKVIDGKEERGRKQQPASSSVWDRLQALQTAFLHIGSNLIFNQAPSCASFCNGAPKVLPITFPALCSGRSVCLVIGWNTVTQEYPGASTEPLFCPAWRSLAECIEKDNETIRWWKVVLLHIQDAAGYF